MLRKTLNLDNERLLGISKNEEKLNENQYLKCFRYLF
jgi:hypothetical protein